ncbi:hypothetical protein IT575_15295 [bacterium]|nr:hypothetical protein [bacterium]
MQPVAYSIALIARGTGAYAYSYLGPPGLARGQLVLVSFRSVLEPGLLLHPDPQPPQATELLSLLPLPVPGYEHLGSVLAALAELCCSGPDEVAGHLLLDQPAAALRLSLQPGDPAALLQWLKQDEAALLLSSAKTPRGRLSGAALLAELARLYGVIGPQKRKALLRACGWPRLAALVQAKALSFSLGLAGTPGVMRRAAAWLNHYQPSAQQAQDWGVEPAVAYPGFYLAGLRETLDLNQLSRVRQATLSPESPPAAEQSAGSNDVQAGFPGAASISWDNLKWERRWDILQRWPGLSLLPLRRAQSAWPLLEGGLLPGELRSSLDAGERVLLILPQAWMLDRLWPALQDLAGRVLRYRPEAGALLAAQLLRQASSDSGALVAGLPGAWKLSAYLDFDRIILVDPAHPQYTPQGEPWLDPRLALLLAASQERSSAGNGAAPRLARIDLLELGLSLIDGRCPLERLQLQATLPSPEQLASWPLPALLYLNRLGGGRELSCAECHSAVPCPHCGGRQLHFSPAQRAYFCPDCAWRAPDLRCPRCGLQNLAAASPGLESLEMPPGAVLLSAASAGEKAELLARAAQAPWLYGTARLLDPPLPYIQRNVIYAHAESVAGVLSDWPAALDDALRLSRLYCDPQSGASGSLLLCGAALCEQLGLTVDSDSSEARESAAPSAIAEAQAFRLSAGEIAALLQTELRLRRLSGLPPYGCVYQLRARGFTREALEAAREVLGQRLQQDKATTLLRLGRVYSAGIEGGRRIQRLGGWLLNPRLGQAELQELRWQLHQLGVSLQFRPLRGPWI